MAIERNHPTGTRADVTDRSEPPLSEYEGRYGFTGNTRTAVATSVLDCIWQKRVLEWEGAQSQMQS